MIRLNLARAALFVSSAALFASTSVYAASGVSVTPSSSLGHGILTDERGMTLYRYTADKDSTSTCYSGCAIAWPPVLVDALPATQDASLAQNLGLTSRTDGNQQLTYNNQPLYYYVGDANPGDTNGQASDGVWVRRGRTERLSQARELSWRKPESLSWRQNLQAVVGTLGAGNSEAVRGVPSYFSTARSRTKPAVSA